MDRDWKIEQLREVETALRNAREKHIYLHGEPCLVTHLMLVQPAIMAHHAGSSLEIDALDAYGNQHEIRLYTADWPEDRRR